MPSRLTTMVWFGVALLWAVMLTLGAVWIRRNPPATAAAHAGPSAACLDASSRDQRPGFVARRALAVNHWIGERDLDWSTASHNAQKAHVLGRYARCAVKTGERLAVTETEPLPATTVASGNVRARLPLDRDPRLVEAVNAGTVLDVEDAAGPIARGVLVLAVECSPPAAGGCSAILDARPDDAARVRAANPGTLRVMIAAPKP